MQDVCACPRRVIVPCERSECRDQFVSASSQVQG